jgi:NCAIR mutase (PurE)-related protein
MAFPPGLGDSDHDLDLDRRRRLGLVEAVWGEHKSPSQIAAIIKAMRSAGELVLVTRVSEEQVAAVLTLLGPEGDVLEGIWHHQAARCLTLPALPVPDPGLGTVAILGAGSSDLAVASEAHLALACHGVASDLILDVGVAGLHRLLGRLAGLGRYRVLIVCAGMEGALPTVVAGLLPQPVIGVPVSVGYGVSKGGRAALQGMLASCAPGLTVVNIDNGYGAAMAALRILQAPRGDGG